jgi:quercetin dioxygenase-like cupin family protein
MAVSKHQEGQRLEVLGDQVCIKLPSAQSANHMAVMTVEVPPEGGVPLHTHLQEEESYYMLEGQMLVQVGSEEIEIGAGDFVHIPAGVVHSYRNTSDQPIRFLAWTVGGAMDSFFQEMAEQIREVPQDFAKMPEILKKYGIQVVGQE